MARGRVLSLVAVVVAGFALLYGCVALSTGSDDAAEAPESIDPPVSASTTDTTATTAPATTAPPVTTAPAPTATETTGEATEDDSDDGSTDVDAPTVNLPAQDLPDIIGPTAPQLSVTSVPLITVPTTAPTTTPTTGTVDAPDEDQGEAASAEAGPVELGNGRGTAQIAYPTRLDVEQQETVTLWLRAVDFRPNGERYDQGDGSRVVDQTDARERREWPIYGAFGQVELTLWTGEDILIEGGAAATHTRFYRSSDRPGLDDRYLMPDGFTSPSDKLDGFADLHAWLRGGMPVEVFIELSEALTPERCLRSLANDPTVEDVQNDVLCRYESHRATLQSAIGTATAAQIDDALDDYLTAIDLTQRRIAGHMATQVVQFDPDGTPRRAQWSITATCRGRSELRVTADRLAVAFPNPSEFPDDDQLADLDPQDLNLWLELDVVATDGARCLNDLDLDGIFDNTDPSRPVPIGQPVDLCPRDPLPGVDRRDQTTDSDGDGRGDACDDDVAAEGFASRFGRWIDAIPPLVAGAALAIPLLIALARLLLPLRGQERAAARAGLPSIEPLAGAAGPGTPGPSDPPTGLVLSGGGMRAAAFSLGVVLYLLDSGRLDTIRNVASVSGGSFTNARMLGLLATDDPGERRNHLRTYRDRLASNGLPLERASAWFLLASLGLVVVLARLLGGWTQLLIVPAVLGLWVIYSLVAQAVVRRWLSALCGIGVADPIAGIESPIRHWFTSSEAGRFPVHISRASVIHLDDDQADDATRRNSVPADDLRVSEVVRASAAFPGLPPVVLSATALGRAPHQTGIGRLLGGRWVLRDGGLFDNLGHIVGTLDDPDTYAELTDRGSIDRWLVVDASAGAKQASRSFFGGLLATLNLGLFPTILQMGTKASADQTSASQRELRARFGRGEPLILVDLGATAETVADLHRNRGDATDRLDDWLAEQQAKGADGSAILNSLAVVSTVPTTLGSIGLENTNTLIRHGYTVAMCHLLLQDPEAPGLDDLDRWRKLDPLDDGAPAELRPPSPRPGA